MKNKSSGIFFGMMSVFCTVIGIILAKDALRSTSAIQASFIRMVAGASGLFLWGLVRGKHQSSLRLLSDFKLLLKVSGIMFIATFGGFFLSLYSLKQIEASVASCLNSTAPLFVIPLAAIFLREKPASIYALAKLVKRTPENVNTDIKFLEQLGFIEVTRTKDIRKKTVPRVNYDKLTLEIPL